MASISATSHAGQLSVNDGRSAESRFLRRVRDELHQQLGGAPNTTQRLLVDRVAHVSLRLHALDCEPLLPENVEYLALTRLLAELLSQIGQPAPSVAHSPLREAAA